MRYVLYAFDPHLRYYDVFRTNSLWGYWRSLPLLPREQLTSSYMMYPVGFDYQD